MIKVSILVPIYGVEKYIERCAVSLFEQSYDNIEYVFINDCTKDNSMTILMEVIEKYPNRKRQVHIINHEQNKGLAAARNTAVENASGDYIMHVDSDDWLELKAVERCVNTIIKTNADIVAFDYFIHNTDNVLIHNNSVCDKQKMLLACLNAEFPAAVWSRIYKRNLYTNIRCIEGANMGEDFQVVPKLLYRSRLFQHIEEPLYHYDKTNEGAYTSGYSKSKSEQLWISMKVNETFFMEKDDAYTLALHQYMARELRRNISCTVRDNDLEYYKTLKLRVKELPSQSISSLPLQYRLFFNLRPFWLLKKYAKITKILK